MAQDTCQDRPQAEPSKQSPPDARALIPTPSQVLLEEKAPKQHTERTSGGGHAATAADGGARARRGVETPQTQPCSRRGGTQRPVTSAGTVPKQGDSLHLGILIRARNLG